MLSEVLIHSSVEIAPFYLVFIRMKNNSIELTKLQAVLSVPAWKFEIVRVQLLCLLKDLLICIHTYTHINHNNQKHWHAAAWHKSTLIWSRMRFWTCLSSCGSNWSLAIQAGGTTVVPDSRDADLSRKWLLYLSHFRGSLLVNSNQSRLLNEAEPHVQHFSFSKTRSQLKKK